MNRRWFLGMMASGAVALAAGTKLGHLIPKLPAAKPFEGVVDVQFTNADLNLSMDDFHARILEPAIRSMAKRVDEDMMRLAFNA